MSESLRDSAERHFQNTLTLMQKGNSTEAFIELENAEETVKHLLKYPENEFVQESFQMNLENVVTLGTLFYNMGRFPQAKKCCELQILIFQKFLEKDPKNIGYQLDVAMTLNNLGILLSNMGRLEDAKDMYEKALDIYGKLLKNDPSNVIYQSHVATTLNNLGNVLKNMGRIEDAKDRYEKALETRQELFKKDPANVTYQSYVAATLNNLGSLLKNMGRIEDAKDMYEKALEMRQELFKKDPVNVTYQSYVAATLNNLGNLLKNMGRIEDAKDRYEKALDIYENLLKNDLANVVYQSSVATILDNLGSLLKNMGHIEEAKQKFERALEIFTEPMQYLTIGKKSNSIIKLIELNKEQAEKETNSHLQIKYLEEAYQLCKKSQEFFNKYDMKHEKKLVMEAGFSAYVEYVMRNIRWEKDSSKRAIACEKAINAVEKMGRIGDNEEVAKIASSTICYLGGRKLVNEALGSEQPDLELINQAVNQFEDAKETYKKANVCYCIYIGLLKVLEDVEIFEEKNGSKAKDLIQQVIEILPEKIDPSIKAAFEEIPKIFDEKDLKSRKKRLEEFDGKIRL